MTSATLVVASIRSVDKLLPWHPNLGARPLPSIQRPWVSLRFFLPLNVLQIYFLSLTQGGFLKIGCVHNRASP
jgi:hypothetical protein